jgi:hypothetical protein
VTAVTGPVKDASRLPPPDSGGHTLCFVPPPFRWRRVLRRRHVMADLAYVLLVIGGFAVLALTLRGLQRL